VADWLHDNPWRQGHALTLEGAKELGLLHPESPDDTVVIVVSHDCDLAVSVDVEPLCEVAIGRKIEALDGNLTNAKSIRRLHLTCSRGKSVSLIELEVHNRRQVKKVDLANHVPAEEILLTAHERSLLQGWLAARYNRPSFPDEFVKRLTDGARKAYRKIERKLADTSSHILTTLFDLDEGNPDTERQLADDVYTLSIYLVYNVDSDQQSPKKSLIRWLLK
jgi:hypothetical protein